MSILPIKPPSLLKGDKIGVLSLASPMLPEKLNQGVRYLKNCGYSVVFGDHVKDSDGYLAGTDKDRLDDLHSMFRNPEVKAIFSSRGGYGTSRLLDNLDFDLICKNPKILMGYSDLTAIQLAIWRRTGLITFSGPMVAVEMTGIDPFTEKNMWSILSSYESDNHFPEGSFVSPEIIVPGKANGRLLGGCLSVLVSILGTPYQPDFDGAILILEEVGEEPYRVDRYFSHLKLMGVFEQVNGVILGQFLDCEAEEGKPSLSITEVINDYLGGLSVPVVCGFQYGHQAKKLTIPIGAQVEIDTEILKVRLLETVVETG